MVDEDCWRRKFPAAEMSAVDLLGPELGHSVPSVFELMKIVTSPIRIKDVVCVFRGRWYW